MEEIRFRIQGTAPLLMHNERLANPMDPIVKQIKALTSKKTKKTEEDVERIMELEFEGGVYFDDKIGPYAPAKNLKACLIEGAKLSRGGTTVERGVMITEPRNPIQYDGPRTVAALWKASYRHVCLVKVGQQKVLRCRPCFTEWAIEFGACFDPSVVSDAKTLASWLETAGRLTGLMDGRPDFGKFDVIAG